MKRTGKKNVQLLRNLISSSFTGDVPRKEIVKLATDNGLIVNDTWPFVKPFSKGSIRGTYNVDEMLELADKILNKGKEEVSVKKVIQKIVEDVKSPVDEVVETKNYGNVSWGEIAYTEDDINDELSLMGTYL